MADTGNNTALHVGKLKAQAQASAAASMAAIEAAAAYLTQLMQDVYGGRYRLQVDHELAFVMIVPKLERDTLEPPAVGEPV